MREGRWAEITAVVSRHKTAFCKDFFCPNMAAERERLFLRNLKYIGQN